ncbi:MAG: Enterobactin exporter EntS [Anaerolineae bacterium]|nr:Enterobactin exporter EntS [Anaerolineae bacterium]
MEINKKPRAFNALRHRDFRLLWIGLLISVAGTQMQNAAINWQTYEISGSALALGGLGLARLIPIIIFSLWGGVVADTRNRRRVMMITQSVMMGSAFTLGLVTWLGIVNLWWIYGLGAVNAAAAAFDMPSRQSLTPNLVPREDLTNAVTLGSMVFQIASIVGPGIAGILIGQFGVGIIYWLNGLSFLALLGAIALMKTATPPKVSYSRAPLQTMLEGMKYVFQERIILSTMLLDFFATFFSGANTLLPIFATDVLRVGPEGYGILAAAESAGSVITGLVLSVWGDIRAKGAALLSGIAIYGAATIGFGLSETFALSILFLALVGAGDTLSTILRSAIRQLVTPDELRGRMTSVNMIFFMGGPQLGEMESGALAALVGAPLAVAFGGAATLVLVGLTALRVPALRHYT